MFEVIVKYKYSSLVYMYGSNKKMNYLQTLLFRLSKASNIDKLQEPT